MSQVEQVRAAADIVKIVGDYVKLRKAGANFVGLCPFHQEKTPSFAVHPVKQIFHCFGCGVGGDVFKFVMLIENLSFPEALRRVAEKVGVRLADETFGRRVDDAQGARARRRCSRFTKRPPSFSPRNWAATAEGRAARAYLADRGLSDEVVGQLPARLCARRRPGAHARTCSMRGFEPKLLEKSGLVLRDAEKAGATSTASGVASSFPSPTNRGKVVAFGGRALGDDQPKYLNSPETPIYTKSRRALSSGPRGQRHSQARLCDPGRRLHGLHRGGFGGHRERRGQLRHEPDGGPDSPPRPLRRAAWW